MATTAIGGSAVHTVGDLPAVGSISPGVSLCGRDFSVVTRTEGKRTLFNIFPSVDTGVCAASVRTFNELAASLDNTEVICVSADLPFALERFCGAEGIENVVVASSFKSTFGRDYGVEMVDGKFEGLLARAIVITDTDGTVLYTQLTDEVPTPVDFEAAVAALS
ncbi:MAG: thiol peroxidase [Nocardioides sp.]